MTSIARAVAGAQDLAGRLACLTSAAALVLLAGAMAPPPARAQAGGAIPQDPSRLLVVDCLLPGQVRKLGGQMTYLSPRRPAKTTASDCEIRGGEYVAYDRANYDTALAVWMPQAQGGDPQAQTYVGEIFEKGLGRAPDYALAAQWYEKAAAQKFTRAQMNLAFLYEQGLGVPKDPVKALNLYRLASGITDDSLTYVSEVTAVRDEMQAKLDELTGQLEAQNAEIENLQAQLQTSRQQLSTQATQLARSREDAQALRRQVDELRAQGPGDAARTAELARLEGELRVRETRVAEQERSVASLEAATAAKRATLADQLRAAADKDDALRAERKDAAASTRAELASVKRQLQETELRVADLTAQLQAERVRIAADRAQLERRAASAAAAQQAEIQRLRSALLAREAELAKQQALIASLQSESQAYKKRMQDLQAAPAPAATLATRSAGPSALAAGVPARSVPRDLRRGTYHALVIGNNRYQHMPNLDTAINDAQAVDGVLRQRYGFRTRVLLDATRADILQALNDYRQTLQADDSLLIYYAGHGELDRANAEGYWLPVNAQRDNTVEWISGQQITAQINLMAARHVMVVADSCYQGVMTRSTGVGFPKVGGEAAQIRRLTNLAKLPSRTVLTSGGEQPVLDGGGGRHSIFAQVLLGVLQSNDRVLEGGSLYNAVFDEVRGAAARLKQEQSPRYDVLADAGHRNGEFLFIPLT